MRKSLSLLIMGIGILLILSSVYPILVVIKHSMEAHEVFRAPVKIGERISTGELKISTEKKVQIAIRLVVQSSSVIETTDGAELRYEFPFEYSVTSSNGTLLHQENTAIGWDSGTKTSIRRNYTLSGGRVQFETGFDKFNLDSQIILVSALIKGDSRYGSKAREIELIVYDTVYSHAVPLIVGAVLLISGAGIAFIGLLLFIMGGTKMSKQTGQRSYVTAILLSLFLGSFGVDRFYLGYTLHGIIKLITFGGCGLWALIDLVLIITGKLQDADGNDLAK